MAQSSPNWISLGSYILKKYHKGVASLSFITRLGINSCCGPDCKDNIFENTKPSLLSATMIYLSGLVGFLLVFTAEARVGNSSELSFCTETEQCLLFDLICKTDNYEVRHYDSVKWVSTDETSWSMDMAAMRAFRRLFDYIKENNIQMTAPVVLKVPVKKYFWDQSTITMSFLLPVEHQKDPIKPIDSKVYINKMPDMKVYVRSYGGWMMGWTDKSNADSLSSSLNSVGAEYTGSFHYGVGYNSPMKIFNRHNEVWFVSEDDPMCGSSEEMDLSPIS